uniref:receptor protein-tyrosine kinase n=1 Tax=Cacopsylla melanoneura TaxID=428564 RepID=A0A8D8TU21_9HEMI
MTTILTTKTSTTTKTLKPTTERPPPPTQPILDTALVVIVCSAFFLLIGCIGTLVVLVRRMRRTVTLIETETTQPADVVADTTNVANTTVVETTAEAVHTTQTQQVITAEETNTQTVQGVQMTQWTKRVIITKEELTTPGTENFFMMPIVKIEKQKTTTNQLASDDVNMAEYDLIPDNKWEFPRQSLSLGETLGEGAFGRVVRAEANGIMTPGTVTTVAVKMLKEDHLDSEMIALVSEMELMKMMGRHVNILNLLGACSQRGPLYVIVEFAKHNDLKHFLRKHRPLPEYSNVVLTDSNQVNLSEEVLVSFAHQVANGMKYLHSRKCLHRDLAARNVLVCQNFILKIADFGLARDVQAKEYYWMDSQPVLPYKWMAPESLSHHLFKYESDVWSYGVLLWEIMTFGEAPYPSIQGWDSMVPYLRSGHRLEKPSHCSDEIYDMMQECWKYEASDRPQFSQ